MRKNTILSICIFGAMIYGLQAQNLQSSVDVVTPNNAERLVQPAQAYFNSSGISVGEEVIDKSMLERPQLDPNVRIPYTGTHGSPETDLLYDNGPHINMPGNPNLSMLESTTLGMNTIGSNISADGGYSAADDFVLDEESSIDFIDVYVYQTGATGPTITGVYMRVWDADPSGSGSQVVWGDMITDLLYDVEEGDDYRVTETSQADRTRSIQTVTANLSGAILPAGTYWLEYALTGSNSSGPWVPPIAILGETTTGNAIQQTSTGWQPMVDSGTNTPQGLPFQIYGTEVLSVNDNALSSFSFYPNPTSDVLNISAGKNIDSVSIYNILGQEILTSNIGSTDSTVSLSSLSTGTYILRVTIEGQVGAYKIVKI